MDSTSIQYLPEDVDAIVAEGGEYNAEPFFKDLMPAELKKFMSLTNQLSTLIKNIKKTFPEASYYSANDGLNLMLGPTHDGPDTIMQQQRVAGSAIDLHELSGGDW